MAFKASVSYILIYFIIILILKLPPMCQSFILSLVFDIIFGTLSPSTPPPSISKLHQNCRYVHKFRRRRLNYHLVIWYRWRVNQLTQWLNGIDFTSPWYVTHRSRRSKKPKAKDRHNLWRVIKPKSKFQWSKRWLLKTNEKSKYWVSTGIHLEQQTYHT